METNASGLVVTNIKMAAFIVGMVFANHAMISMVTGYAGMMKQF